MGLPVAMGSRCRPVSTGVTIPCRPTVPPAGPGGEGLSRVCGAAKTDKTQPYRSAHVCKATGHKEGRPRGQARRSGAGCLPAAWEAAPATPVQPGEGAAATRTLEEPDDPRLGGVLTRHWSIREVIQTSTLSRPPHAGAPAATSRATPRAEYAAARADLERGRPPTEKPVRKCQMLRTLGILRNGPVKPLSNKSCPESLG